MKKQHLTLTDDDRRDLETLLSKGNLKALTFKRATALLELDRGKSLVAVATTLGVTTKAVANWRTRYVRSGLKCLDDAPRSGRPTVFDGLQRAKITALATSDVPEGYARWSLRLLADKAVESGICDDVSYTFVREVLKKTTSSRT
jgi:putative transposase